MKTTVYLSRKLLNQLKVKETESKDLMLTHNLHNIIINGKRVGCSGHIQNVLNNKCVYVSTEKSCYQPLSDKNLVRYAASMKDYSSVSLGAKGRNQFVTNDELVEKLLICSDKGINRKRKTHENRHQESDSNSICCGSCSAHCYERLCNCGEHYL